MNDHESRDLAGAAYLAREADAYDVDRPGPEDLDWDEPRCPCGAPYAFCEGCLPEELPR